MKEDIRQALVETALEMGAEDARVFGIDEVAFDPRPLLKCLFGCPGGMHYCPTVNNAATWTLFPDIIKKYKWGVVLRTSDLKKGQEITLALESKAFLAGYTFAFGASECANCSTCTAEKQLPCVNPRNQRPPLYSLGIDVYKTVRGLGWELEVVQEKGDPAKNITAVFVE